MFTVVYCHQPCRRQKIEKSTVETEVGRPRTEDGKDEFFRHLPSLALAVVPSSALCPPSSQQFSFWRNKANGRRRRHSHERESIVPQATVSAGSGHDDQ